MGALLPSRASLLLALQLVSLFLHDTKGEWLQTTKLTDSDGEANDLFGWAVATDNGILVVGADSDDIDGAAFAGSVTTFEWSNGAWVAQQKLTASDAEANDYFGWSVAISNGVVAVGANREDDGASEAGAVYIYEKGADGAWTEMQKLIHSDAAAGDWFGWSLAMHGNTLIAGANNDDDFSGSVFLFTLLATGTWTQDAKLTSSDRSAWDYFGTSVAIDVDTIVVGAAGDDDLGGVSGSAYVFQRAGEESSWTEVAKLTPSDGQSFDYFGGSVALEGSSIFVGSYNNAVGDNVGAVYQFGEEMATWTQQNKLVARDSVEDAWFGNALAVRDGTLVVGARGQSSFAGAVYLFESLAEGTWTQRAKLVASDGAAGDYFGFAVGVDDGMVIAGAHVDDAGQGSVYAFEWRGSVSPSIMPTFFPTGKVT